MTIKRESLKILVYSQDVIFCRKVEAYLEAVAHTSVFSRWEDLKFNIYQKPDSVIVFDLRAEKSVDLILNYATDVPDAALIAVGDARSEPGLIARSAGVFSLESADNQLHLQMTAANALALVDLKRRNRFLRNENTELKGSLKALQDQHKSARGSSRKIFLRTFRDFGDVNALLENVVREISAGAFVARVGIFLEDPSCGVYRFRAGINCLHTSRDIEYRPENEFACWLEMKSHIISTETIDHIDNHCEKLFLNDVLKDMGAAAIIPLRSSDRTFGWIFIGPHTTGIPFSLEELEEVGRIAEQVSADINNAILMEEIDVQRLLADAVINVIPLGIVSVETDGSIKWINHRASELTGIDLKDQSRIKAEILGPQIADALHRALDGEELLQAYDFRCANTGRQISMETRSLAANDDCIGALAILDDRDLQAATKSGDEDLRREAFWIELASAMSHEIHNPLVTIKTFAQLMPERYSDAEFRNEFRARMLNEVNRLTNIVSQINRFAHPPQLTFRSIDIRKVAMQGAQDAAQQQPRVSLNLKCDENDIPKIKGDEKALTECFSHLVQNSIEARSHSSEVDVDIRITTDDADGGQGRVAIEIHDNGKGIPPEIDANIYSPFCTTKARGMGLGLPLARRTIEDHRGTIGISSGKDGSVVSISLPVDRGAST